MKYDGPGIPPDLIAQKARVLQMRRYELRGVPGVLPSPEDFDELTNIVTALCEATQWVFEHMHDHVMVQQPAIRNTTVNRM